MIPPASSKTESSSDRPRTNDGLASDVGTVLSAATVGDSVIYPMPSSSGDSSGVPQRRQMTAEQSPHVSGSVTSRLHTGQ